MTLGIRGKLFLVSLGLISISVLVEYSYQRTELESQLTTREYERASERALVVARALEGSIDAAGSEEAWSALVHDIANRSHASIAIVADEGRVLANSSDDDAAARQLGLRPEVESLLGGHGLEASTPIVQGGELHVAAPVIRDNGKRAVVWVSYPLTELESAVAALGRPLTAALVLALAVAVVLSSIAAELASRTARSLTQVARRMAGGDLSARARLATRDEFGDLGRALDQLARGFSQSLASLSEERDRLSGILSGMQEGVLLLDASGRIALLNPALREMLLLGVDAVGKTLLEAIRHAELKELLDEARGSLDSVTREIDVGGIKPRRVLVRVAQVPGEEGQLFAVFVDVTEVRRLESMRRDFVANVSHELRTPVTAIRSASETLQSGVPEDPKILLQFLGIIERNASRLHDLVEDVLDLSHIESRQLRLNMEALDLRSVYGQVLSLFRERADKKNIRLSNEVEGELSRVRADRRALEHVLTNLVDNAIKYCGNGTAVRMGAVELDDGVRLLVTDDGPGIEARHLPRIFERFYRVDTGRSRELGGTGLGLSLVKHLAEAMGGSVQVESKPGSGTTFSIFLKKAESERRMAVA